ncbi:MAG: type II toxin-antitoxin system RelE/ParE family toxin [Planctomycetaceae bacterium]|nr:type II toxin-antitoxin system RelE/ParE family toxin [Planctomycetaceae bacterium]
MSYRIEFRPAALRQMRRIPKVFKARLMTAIAALSHTPRPPGSVQLAGPDDFHRIRVGDYRVIYLIHDRVLLICVVRIGHRRDVYREL